MPTRKVKGEGEPVLEPVVIHAPAPDVVCIRCGKLTYSLGKDIPYCKECYKELTKRGLV